MRFCRAVIEAREADARKEGEEVFLYNGNTVMSFFKREMVRRRLELKEKPFGVEPHHGTYYRCVDDLISQWDLVTANRVSSSQQSSDEVVAEAVRKERRRINL
jgi:hypothetical protein